jgi:hypothetical protein
MLRVMKRYSGWLPDAEIKAGEPNMGEFYPYDDSEDNYGVGFLGLDAQWHHNNHKDIFMYGEMMGYFRQLI